MQPPSTRREFLSVGDYAARTGISPTEIRRQIRVGALPAEKFQRPQGTFYRIAVDTPEDTPEDTPAPAESIESVQTPSTSQDTPGALTAALEAVTSLVERNATLSDRVSALEREAGELGGSVDAYRREVEWLKAELERARRPWWQKLRGK